MNCPYCEAGYTVFRSDFYDGKGSRRLHHIIAEDGEDLSVFCQKGVFLSRHRLAALCVAALVIWAAAVGLEWWFR